MKKFIKILSILVLLTAVLIVGVTTYQYNTYTPVAVAQSANPEDCHMLYPRGAFYDDNSMCLFPCEKLF